MSRHWPFCCVSCYCVLLLLLLCDFLFVCLFVVFWGGMFCCCCFVVVVVCCFCCCLVIVVVVFVVVWLLLLLFVDFVVVWLLLLLFGYCCCCFLFTWRTTTDTAKLECLAAESLNLMLLHKAVEVFYSLWYRPYLYNTVEYRAVGLFSASVSPKQINSLPHLVSLPSVASCAWRQSTCRCISQSGDPMRLMGRYNWSSN